MNKKGFISISSVYAFFLVFLLLLLFIVNEMISNRIMINNIKNEVKEEISKFDENQNNFTLYIKSLYTSQGTNGIYYHDASLINGAEDNSYRYSGANPNNYVCFGSDDDACPDDYLYRIIGVFGEEVKLVKLTSLGNYAWDSENDNDWVSSDVKKILNETYYNTFSSEWQNKIATHLWNIGGMEWSTTNTAKEYYDKEIGNLASNVTDSSKIGLLYVSDFGFAPDSSCWETALWNYRETTVKSNNWLFLADSEMTMSSFLTDDTYNFYLSISGSLSYCNANYNCGVRPTFYLNSNVSYISGSGTSSNPYRIG